MTASEKQELRRAKRPDISTVLRHTVEAATRSGIHPTALIAFDIRRYLQI